MTVGVKYSRNVQTMVLYTSNRTAAYCTCPKICLFPRLPGVMRTRFTYIITNYSILNCCDAHHDIELGTYLLEIRVI